LGIVGGLLTLAWMLRMAWELTQPAIVVTESAEAVEEEKPVKHWQAVAFVIITPIVAFAVNAIIAIDFNQQGAWVTLELFRRLAFVLVMAAGLGLTLMRSMRRQEIDDRPAPWIYASLIVAVALFLLHNLIDFSMFEPGTMSVFALLLGAALGMRLPHRPRRPWGTAGVIGVFIVGGVAWFTALGAGFGSVAQAEMLAADGDTIIRNNGEPADACERYVKASNLVPINGDYAYRAAYLSPAAASQLLEKAIVSDPLAVRYRRSLAQLELKTKRFNEALKALAACVELDPNNMDLRIEYGKALQANKRFDEARIQFEAALKVNDALPEKEIQRLPNKTRDEVQAAIAALPGK
jgi:hypothetical protein